MTLAMAGSREARALLHKTTKKKRWVEPSDRCLVAKEWTGD
jgi:hypothetical protein